MIRFFLHDLIYKMLTESIKADIRPFISHFVIPVVVMSALSYFITKLVGVGPVILMWIAAVFFAASMLFDKYINKADELATKIRQMTDTDKQRIGKGVITSF